MQKQKQKQKHVVKSIVRNKFDQNLFSIMGSNKNCYFFYVQLLVVYIGKQKGILILTPFL